LGEAVRGADGKAKDATRESARKGDEKNKRRSEWASDGRKRSEKAKGASEE
jgi:hypothetical protein